MDVVVVTLQSSTLKSKPIEPFVLRRLLLFQAYGMCFSNRFFLLFIFVFVGQITFCNLFEARVYPSDGLTIHVK